MVILQVSDFSVPPHYVNSSVVSLVSTFLLFSSCAQEVKMTDPSMGMVSCWDRFNIFLCRSLIQSLYKLHTYATNLLCLLEDIFCRNGGLNHFTFSVTLLYCSKRSQRGCTKHKADTGDSYFSHTQPSVFSA